MGQKNQMQNTRETFRVLWQAFGSYKTNIALILVLSVFSSIFEGLGIGAIIPAFSFVAGGGAGTDTLSHFIQSLFAFLHLPYSFRFLILFIGGLFVARTLAILLMQYIAAQIVSGYERDMRNLLFSSMVRSRWPHLSHQKVGHLEQLIITNASNTSQFLSFFSTFVLMMTKMIMYVLIAINLSLLAAVGSVLVGILVLLVLLPFYARNRAINTTIELAHRELTHFVSQHVSGMKVVKAMAIEKPVAKVAFDYFDRIRTGSVNSSVLRGIMTTFIQFAGLAFVAGVFVIMYKSPNFNLAAFTVIVYAINQIFVQVQVGQNQLHAAGSLTPYMMAAYAYVEEARKEAEVHASGLPFSFQREIAFSNVSFSYPGRGVVLAGASFRIPRGSVVGIIGPSGAGKTTIADLLLRLQSPSEGVIFADGADIQAIGLDAWRAHVGYVPQDPFLLNDTVAHNIAFYDTSISRDDIKEAAKAADIHAFIESLPEGYDTRVGDRGVLFSGGQRQRIVLARALARKPALLVLDEATSSLDAESERAIRETVVRLGGSITVVIIAHRFSIVSSADTLIVLKNGKVTEAGTPVELRADRDSYIHRMSAEDVRES